MEIFHNSYSPPPQKHRKREQKLFLLRFASLLLGLLPKAQSPDLKVQLRLIRQCFNGSLLPKKSGNEEKRKRKCTMEKTKQINLKIIIRQRIIQNLPPNQQLLLLPHLSPNRQKVVKSKSMKNQIIYLLR